FRPMVAAANPTDFLVASFDGGHHMLPGHEIDHAAHEQLSWLVGYAFVVGFGLAVLIYWKGLDLAERIKQALRPVYTVLEHKFYFDELYNAFLVGGVLVLKSVAYAFDRFFVDGLVDRSATVTGWLAMVGGRAIEAKGVDGLVNA